MKRRLVLIKVYLFCFFIYSCQEKSTLDKALEYSGNNRIEVEQVLEHYKADKDSLKLKASIFLISNMIYNKSIDYSYYDKHGNNKIPEFIKYTQDELKKIISTEGGRFKMVSTREDIKTITAGYLIENIDLAFEVWQKYPWCKHLSFNDFCSQILPYKVVDEPLDNWRSFYYSKHKKELDSLNKVKATLDDVIFWFNKKYERKYISSTSIVPGNFSYKTFEEIGGGNCADLAQNAVKVMRACGIPLHMDIVTYHGRVNGNHVYNSIDLPNGDFYFFSPYERAPERRDWRAHKVMRLMCKIQDKEIYKYLKTKEIPIKELFVNPFYKDVTANYFPTKDIEVSSTRNNPSEDLLYLCTYNKGFHAIDWSDMKNQKYHFNDITKELLYFPMFYRNNEYESASLPFVLRENGEKQLINRDFNKKVTIKGAKVLEIKKNITELSNKYEVFFWKDKWVFFKNVQANKDKTITIEGLPEKGLYLISGEGFHESKQRPFTYFNNIIEYW